MNPRPRLGLRRRHPLAATGQAVTVDPIAQVAGGRGLGAGRSNEPDDCDVPVVELPDGGQQTVEVPR